MEHLAQQQAPLMAAHAQNQYAIAQLAATSPSVPYVTQSLAHSLAQMANVAPMLAAANVQMEKPPGNALETSSPQLAPHTGAEDPAMWILQVKSASDAHDIALAK